MAGGTFAAADLERFAADLLAAIPAAQPIGQAPFPPQ